MSKNRAGNNHMQPGQAIVRVSDVARPDTVSGDAEVSEVGEPSEISEPSEMGEISEISEIVELEVEDIEELDPADLLFAPPPAPPRRPVGRKRALAVDEPSPFLRALLDL